MSNSFVGKKIFRNYLSFKAYEYEYQLVEHTKLKHEGIAYKCDFCPKTYSVKKSVDNHVRTAHPEQGNLLEGIDNKTRLEKILKGSLNSIPSPSVKNSNYGRESFLEV